MEVRTKYYQILELGHLFEIHNCKRWKNEFFHPDWQEYTHETVVISRKSDALASTSPAWCESNLLVLSLSGSLKEKIGNSIST